MKLKLQFKDPDGVWDSLNDCFADPNELPEDVEKALKRYIEFGEYVTIEIDTLTGEARVVPL